MKTINEINLRDLIESETGRKFNRDNKMLCPFHSEKIPSFSIKFDSKANKWKWKCFGGCDESGDAIDFIRKFKNMTYIEAIRYLGIEENSKEVNSNFEKVRKRIEWEIEKLDYRKNLKLSALYKFEDKKNVEVYYKAKFVNEKGEKSITYYSIDYDGKVVNKRLSDEVPYNYYSMLMQLRSNKSIVIVEGEKDVDTLNKLGYIATSFKGFSRGTDFDFECFRNAKVIFCGDTGEAGKKYLEQIKQYMFNIVESFMVIELPGIEKLGDNADITDWLENGHTKEELEAAFEDGWDIKKNLVYKYVEEKVNRNNEKIYTPIKIWENLECLLNSKNIKIRYNKLSKEMECIGNVSSTYGENAIIEDIYSLNMKAGLNLTYEGVMRGLRRISVKNSYSPVQEFLLSAYKRWDGSKNNIDKLCDTVIQKDSFNESIKKLYIKKWLLNAVNIAFNERGMYGTEGMLVFQGKQGLRKTSWVKQLVPQYEWVKTGSDINPADKDSIFKNTKYWFVELGEIDTTFKYDIGKLRQFITEGIDEYRRPYERISEKHNRLTCFFGTVNRKDFLIDETGNRRYWVIPVEKVCIEKFKEIDLFNLWGEVMYLWKSKEKHYFDQQELELLNLINQEFTKETEEYNILSDKLDWNKPKEEWIKYSPTDLAEILGVKSRKLKGELAKFDIEQERENDKSRSRYYLCPPLKESIYNELKINN